jgi:hypothetical protein
MVADMFATLDWSADDDIPVADGSSAAELRGVLCGLGIRTRRVSQNS